MIKPPLFPRRYGGTAAKLRREDSHEVTPLGDPPADPGDASGAKPVESPPMPPTEVPRRAPAIVLLVLGGILAMTLLRFRGPAPRPVSAPPNEFSAARALDVHRQVIGNAPHPVGSAE